MMALFKFKNRLAGLGGSCHKNFNNLSERLELPPFICSYSAEVVFSASDFFMDFVQAYSAITCTSPRLS